MREIRNEHVHGGDCRRWEQHRQSDPKRIVSRPFCALSKTRIEPARVLFVVHRLSMNCSLSACDVVFTILGLAVTIRSPLVSNLRPIILGVKLRHGAILLPRRAPPSSNPTIAMMAIGLIVVTGCTHQFGPYKYGSFEDNAYKRDLDENPSILRGEPHKTMDGSAARAARLALSRDLS